MKDLTFRAGEPADAHEIAGLHITSWQQAYRGILSDAYLDDAIVQDRMAFWSERLGGKPAASIYIQLAHSQPAHLQLKEQGETLVGFVCAILDKDPLWGTLIDNLHVHPILQGRGLGRKLMKDAAQWVVNQNPSGSMYLWVYEANLKARRFYESIGGEAVEQKKEQQPDGRDAEIVRYSWRQLEPFLLLRF